MADILLTDPQRAILLDAHASLAYGGLAEAGNAWVPDHPDMSHEHRTADVEALARAGLLQVCGKRPMRFANITEEGLLELEFITDQDRLQIAVDLLKSIMPDNRLNALYKLVTRNGGRWDLPHDAGHRSYRPIMVSAQLFGVTAFADTVEELPQNWLRAAENTLKGFCDQDVAR